MSFLDEFSPEQKTLLVSIFGIVTSLNLNNKDKLTLSSILSLVSQALATDAAFSTAQDEKEKAKNQMDSLQNQVEDLNKQVHLLKRDFKK